MDDPQHLTLPAPLANRFEALRVLGRGGFGSVLLCRDRSTGGEVALKVLSMEVDDARQRQRFDREARVTEGLTHPHIVRVLDHGILGDVPFIAYEVIPGESLAERLERSGPVSEAEVERWAIGIAAALAEAHRAGVVHRDVKPENILLRSDDAAVLCDFGVARKPAAATFMTAEGLVLGTPAFLAPEVWLGEPPGPAADQFAWAATFYQALTGRTIYGATAPNEVLERVLARAPLGTVATSERPALGRTLARAGAAQASARYLDMDSVVTALQNSVVPNSGETIAQEVTGPGRASPKPTQVVRARQTGPRRTTAPAGRARRRQSRTLMVAAVSACLVGGYLGTASDSGPTDAAPVPAPAEVTSTESDLKKRWQELLSVEKDMRRFFFREKAPTPWKTPRDFHGWLYSEAFADPAAPFKWRRMMRAVNAWTAEVIRSRALEHPDNPGSSWPVNAYDRRVRKVGSFLQSVLACHRESFTEAWSIEGRALLESSELLERMRSVRIRYVEVTQELENLLPEVIPAGGPAPLALRSLQIWLGQVYNSEQLAPWCSDVYRDIFSSSLPESVAHARFLYLQGLGAQAGTRWFSCEQARVNFERLQEFLLEEWSYRNNNSVLRQSVQYLLQAVFKLIIVCPSSWSAALQAQVEELVVQVEAIAKLPIPANYHVNTRWAESAERRMAMAAFPAPGIATDWRRRIAKVKTMMEAQRIPLDEDPSP